MKQISNIKIISITVLLTVGSLFSSCNYLDIVPDDVATIDHAFASEIEAEKYLYTCYSFLPDLANLAANPSLVAGDEIWMAYPRLQPQAYTWDYIARNMQNSNDPIANYWDGSMEGQPYFMAIRECNTFLENVSDMSKVKDLTLDKRSRWLAEVKFLKAYYHFFLLRMYGPIPIVDKNLPISATAEEMQIKRQPVDECVQYISDLLDESYADLPTSIRVKGEYGRIDKAINRALKAKLLLMAASPLFNGNPDYANFKDEEGNPYFNPVEDATKWEKAAEAAKQAIDDATNASHDLFYFDQSMSGFKLSETSLIQMSIRHAVCERWNKEIVWGLSDSRATTMQNYCMPRLTNEMTLTLCYAALAPTLKIAQQFYTKNGVPIEEDKTLDFSTINELRTATDDEVYNFDVRFETARLNFDRENRFYACMGFDGGKWLMSDIASRNDAEAYVVKAKKNQLAAGNPLGLHSESGYFIKKLVHWDSSFTNTNNAIKEYPWPAIRLADVYLMYAEALNEWQGPVDDVHEYVNRVRKRAGLESVAYSGTNFSKNPAKPTTKEGMREIIRRERLNELCFEGSRLWDLRRWKTAATELNNPITGWDINQTEAIDYYQVRTLFQQKFVIPRDYLWPIKDYQLTVNPALRQNPGW